MLFRSTTEIYTLWHTLSLHDALPIRGQYQYFTQADVDSLRRAGYNAGFTPLEDAVARYVKQHLDTADRYR